MNKLLHANLSRLWKSRLFWCVAAATALISALSMLNFCRQAALSDFEHVLDDYFFMLAPLLGQPCAVFTSLFLGTEYSEGTIRNKLIVGHHRRDIYLAGFLTCCLASLIFVAAWFLGSLVGLPFLGTPQMGAAGFFLCLLIVLLFTAALTAVFTLMALLCSNKAANAVLSLLLLLALIYCASAPYNALCEPELSGGVIITSEGMQLAEPEPNPFYVSGSLRTVYELIIDLLPTGQAILLANTETGHPLRQMAFSLLLTAALTLAGVAAFKRKDIK